MREIIIPARRWAKVFATPGGLPLKRWPCRTSIKNGEHAFPLKSWELISLQQCQQRQTIKMILVKVFSLNELAFNIVLLDFCEIRNSENLYFVMIFYTIYLVRLYDYIYDDLGWRKNLKINVSSISEDNAFLCFYIASNSFILLRNLFGEYLISECRFLLNLSATSSHFWTDAQASTSSSRILRQSTSQGIMTWLSTYLSVRVWRQDVSEVTFPPEQKTINL